MTGIVIIGGGVIGSSAAYHLALAGAAADTVVVEPDPTYEHAATPRSVGGVRVQFSLPECIQMSQYGHEVYGAFDDLMTVDGDAPSLSLIRRGYLYMGGGPLDVRRLNQAAAIQREHGANIELLDADEIRTRWPSIETHDVDVGSFSPGDAIIDPHGALMGFRKKASSLGVEYLKDRVVGLDTAARRVNEVVLESGRRLHPDVVINAANCWAPDICAMVGMKIPVAPMRRMCFYYDCQTAIEDLPLMRHVSAGDGFRPEGSGYLTGISRYDEPRGFNWAVDYELFDDVLWPGLALRIKAFEAVKLQRAWSCHYDQNSLDANMILDSWPGKLDNFYIACGLSGHGLQHAPAIGRALKELILDGEFQTLDLSRFGYQRVVENCPIEDISVLS
jgi:glycine/D-amino acid oxidase-like deaminating enzyme